MTKIIKSKPLRFNGVKYRSILEAYWAAFFMKMGIVFHYEPKNYYLDYHWLHIDVKSATASSIQYKGGYLPDFYLRNVYTSSHKDGKPGLWVEVKNPQLYHSEGYERNLIERKIFALSYRTQRPCTVLAGKPTFFFKNDAVECEDDEPMLYVTYDDKSPGEDYPYFFHCCSECGKISFTFMSRSDYAKHEKDCESHMRLSHGKYNYQAEQAMASKASAAVNAVNHVRQGDIDGWAYPWHK